MTDSSQNPIRNVLVIGGHGKVALLLAPLLAGQGIAVNAVIRNPDHVDDVFAAGATPVIADVERLDELALTELLTGHDAVVWSAGAGGGNPARTRAVDRDAAIRSMDAAVSAGARRYVMVSYFGARADHGVPAGNPFWHYAEAKAAADDHLRGTPLDWTILGPSALTLDPPTGAISVGGAAAKVGRADVAAVIAAALQEPATIRQTIRFNTGGSPIAEALRSLSVDASATS